MPVLNTIHHPENREMTVLLRPKDLHGPSLSGLVVFVAIFFNCPRCIAGIYRYRTRVTLYDGFGSSYVIADHSVQFYGAITQFEITIGVRPSILNPDRDS